MSKWKLFQDFGVTAFIGTLVLIGSFALLIIGVVKEVIDPVVLVALVGSWVGSIVSAFFVIKSAKNNK